MDEEYIDELALYDVVQGDIEFEALLLDGLLLFDELQQVVVAGLELGHALERGIGNHKRWHSVTPRKDGRIEKDTWYKLRGRCEGNRIRVWLNDAQVIAYTDDGAGPKHGRPGIGTCDVEMH